MKAAKLYGVNDLRIEELPDPNPADDEVVIQVKACGVCATDVNMWRGTSSEGEFPFVPGHEWSGEIVEVGRGVKDYIVGDRVVGEICVPCGACANCKDGLPPEACMNFELYGFRTNNPGAMAEFHLARASRLHHIPDGLSYEDAALLEPVWVAYNSIWEKGGGVGPHDRMVVFGCGPIGLLAVLTGKASGALIVVVEPQPYRRKLALELGADVAVDPTEGGLEEQVCAHTGGRGASLVVECSGNDAARAGALDVLANRGRIVLIGLGGNHNVPIIDLDKAIFKGATISGGDGSSFFLSKTLAFLSRQLVDVGRVITHRFSLEHVVKALELGGTQGESSKIMIIP
jgi:L-iditol 2-dehydrogenase